jgi:hypothetical protein
MIAHISLRRPKAIILNREAVTFLEKKQENEFEP